MVSPELDKDVHELLSKLLVVLSYCLVHLAYQVLHFGYHSLLYRREVSLLPGNRNEFDDAVGCIFEVLILVGFEFSEDQLDQGCTVGSESLEDLVRQAQLNPAIEGIH
jgi:hypothetical protein